MNASEAFSLLRGLRVPVVTTADAIGLLGLAPDAATHTLRRLARAGLISSLRRGLWGVQENVDPLVVSSYVTAPYPAYVSLQSALYQHGMIMQIPAMVYLVSLGRSSRVKTGVAVYSVHHIAPELFDGYTLEPSGFRLATVEKALVDLLYLAGTRSRLFAALPEVELPRAFRRHEARRWIARIPARRLAAAVERRLDELLARARRKA